MAVNTHGHVDHMLGVNYVKDTYGVPFAIDRARCLSDRVGADSRRDLRVSGRFGAGHRRRPQGQKEIRFGHTTMRIIETPGHTPGHIALYNPEQKLLLTGDTLFRESIGRTDLPGGDYSWIMRSILDKLMPLGDDVHFYPGHGQDSTIGHEALYNPFVTEVLGGEVNC